MMIKFFDFVANDRTANLYAASIHCYNIFGRVLRLDIMHIWWNTYPPPGLKISINLMTSFFIWSGVAKGSKCWASIPPPQKTILSSKLSFQLNGIHILALIWTGLIISTPISIRSGIYSMHEPQVWYQTLGLVKEWICCLISFAAV